MESSMVSIYENMNNNKIEKRKIVSEEIGEKKMKNED
jgi:hypothetical protein